MTGSDQPEVSRQERRDLPWAAAIVLLGVLVFWKLQPRDGNTPSALSANRSAGCLSNLNRIAQGFALYAADWDGKFPRGKDAEDRERPEAWRNLRFDGAVYYQDVRRAPMLPDLLAAYRVPRPAWHCPADVGWSTPRWSGGGPTALTDVHPSAWRKFGMSYFYFTKMGMSGRRAGDLGEGAAQIPLLFDGEFWHPDASGGPPRGGALFADGHAGLLTPLEFRQLLPN